MGTLLPDYTIAGTFDPQTGTGNCQLPRICGTGGARRWGMRRTKDGHREYTLKARVETLRSPYHGPMAALYAPGLPVPGSVWNFGEYENDIYAFCTHEVQIDQVMSDGEVNNYFDLTYTFSTSPQETCYLDWTDDPVLRPDKLSGNFVRYTEEAVNDRFGEPILSSSWERITGPKVEFDANRPQIHIENWSATLDLATLCEYIDGVNDYSLWGFPPRSIKFSACSWRQLYRANCVCVYHRVLEFDINPNTFDREILDEGTKVLHGEWDRASGTWKVKPLGVTAGGELIMPDRTNPSHFVRYVDPNSNVTRVILNGQGVPWNPGRYTSGTATASLGTDDDEKGYISVEKYQSRNLLLLGIPATLECF